MTFIDWVFSSFMFSAAVGVAIFIGMMIVGMILKGLGAI